MNEDEGTLGTEKLKTVSLYAPKGKLLVNQNNVFERRLRDT